MHMTACEAVDFISALLSLSSVTSTSTGSHIFMAVNDVLYADMPLRNYSVTESSS